MKQKKTLTMKERFLKVFEKIEERSTTRAFRRWEKGWKRNARYMGKPLTRSMIRRVGSRERAIELGLINGNLFIKRKGVQLQ